MNYYVLLGVSQDADPDTIRSAFRARARQYRPDAGQGSSDRFREILTAYETLNDPNRRGNYDRLLQNTRATIPRVVESLRPQAVPEPMLNRQRVVDRDSDRSLRRVLAPESTSCFSRGKKCSFEISDAAIIFERPSGSPSPVSDML
jgi:curved DNA-binding protein CbpA